MIPGNTPIPHRLLYAALGLGLLLSGCGYRQAGTPSARAGGSLYRSDVRTVAIPIFTSRAFHRGVEFDLTRALVNHVEANTPYKVAPRERADSIIEGEVVSVDVNPVSTQRRTALPQEQLMTVTVNFIWKDLRSGQILRNRRNFQQTASYFPTLGEGQFIGSQSAAERLALAIVHDLQADW